MTMEFFKAAVLFVSPRHPGATLVEEPPLVVRDQQGKRTDEFVALRADMGMPP